MGKNRGDRDMEGTTVWWIRHYRKALTAPELNWEIWFETPPHPLPVKAFTAIHLLKYALKI